MATRRISKLIRGQARVSDLTRELDELEVESGEAFYLVPAKELERTIGENSVGGARSSDPSTSKDAAVDVFPRSGSQRRRIFEAIAAAGADGLTSEEVSEITGIPFARSSGPRISELKRGGWIETHGTREGSMGAEQEVLVLTAKGQAAAETEVLA